MRSTNFLCRLIAVIVGLAGSMHAAENIRFNRDVRPILSNTCLECHGLDAKKREADLRLDSREGAIAELESGEGRAIVPDKPDESILLARITSHDADQKMPPPDSGKTLTEAQIDILRKWISQGANYERHWAFVAPESAPLPKVKQTA
ncbi:MAG: c-type cytochrome domain-containing protein, partial [Pirellulales bacterium]